MEKYIMKNQNILGKSAQVIFILLCVIPIILSACPADKSDYGETEIIKFNVNKGSHENGNFTITPEFAEEGSIVILKPQANEGNEFSNWTFFPQNVPTSNIGNGRWIFVMPSANLTVSAVFSAIVINNDNKNGIKTITVKGGLGRSPGKSTGTDVYDGTRSITVTVTLTEGQITNVVIGHPVEHPVFAGNNPFRTNANNLAAAIVNTGNADAVFTPSGNYTGAVRTAWNNHELVIRNAVKTAVSEIRAGNVNRVLAGGGSRLTPWTADGEPISGEVSVTGSGFMRSGGMASDSNLPTDLTADVVLTDGLITAVTFSGDETLCNWGGAATMTQRLLNIWPIGIRLSNNYHDIDAISGATITYNAIRDLIEMAISKLTNEY